MRFKRLTISILTLLIFAICPDQGNAQLLGAPSAPKSQATATRLSTIPTIATMLLGGVLIEIARKDRFDRSSLDNIDFGIWVTGVVVGPSLGYYYADDNKRGSTGLGIRGIAVFSSIILLSIDRSRYRRDALGVAGMLGVGLRLAAVGSAIYDMRNVKKSVPKYNRRHGLARIPKIQLTPIYLANRKAPGLGVQITL